VGDLVLSGITRLAVAVLAALCVSALPLPVFARPGPSSAQGQEPQTRAEVIEQQRRDKIARLWPEYESPIVTALNQLLERGLLSEAGQGGANGWQFVLGGMRSGQGFSLGGGYRRTDLLHESLDVRTTLRGTPQLAWMLDGEFEFQRLSTSRSRVRLYTRYEYSPQMDYYGPGPESSVENRTSYRLEDFSADLSVDFGVARNLRLGLRAGLYAASNGAGKRDGVPSTDEVFDPLVVPGLGIDSKFFRFSGSAEYQWLDFPGAPKAGGDYFVEAIRYSDVDDQVFSFWRINADAVHYVPYFNKTRVIALYVGARISITDTGERVPFYLQPKLGGNDNLRGFARYRFYDDNMILATIEHRWHSFAGLDVALFVDTGQVAPKIRDLTPDDWLLNAGLGFRFKVQESVIMRIDSAYGSEGFRFMWTFSDIFKRRMRFP